MNHFSLFSFLCCIFLISSAAENIKQETDYVEDEIYQKPYQSNYPVQQSPERKITLPTYSGKQYQPRINYYDTRAGSYAKESYGGPLVYLGRAQTPQSVYSFYLSSPHYRSYAKRCRRSYGQIPKISVDSLEQAFSYARLAVQDYLTVEKKAYSSGNYLNVSVHSSAARSQITGYLSREDPLYIKEREALFMEFATKYLTKHHCLSKYEVTSLLPAVKLNRAPNPYGDKSCYASYGTKGYQDIICDPHSKYRTYDGSCNNLVHKYWGKSFVCHIRLLPAAYEDGVSVPRKLSVTGSKLPGPREISSYVHFETRDRSYYTHMKMQWGQYINHDITHTPTSQAEYPGLIDCCRTHSHPQCMPIHVPRGDYLHSRYKKSCINFVRTPPCPLCTLGPRQQPNIGTSFLDNSAIYGNTPEQALKLRTFKFGLLKTGRDIYGKEIPPPTTRPYKDQCSSPFKNMLCFESGDLRLNQHPGIQWAHNVFIRRHNQHCRNLKKVNPHWDDERLYQEARRITIAELQHITYNEYFPIVFGPILMEYYNLDTMHPGYSYYEPYTDPTTWNDYSTAACRFGHSQVSSFFSLIGYRPKGDRHVSYGPSYNTSMKGFHLRDYFFNPILMHEGWHDAITLGLLHDRAMLVDPWITGDLHNYLYRSAHERSGGDLPAFNIQRGRDHGIPPYSAYVKLCFSIVIKSWKDLQLFIPPDQIYYLKKLYSDPCDIDLFAGLLSEKKFPDADIGPTTACILGVQYYHLKFGDRFFFTHGHQKGSFTLVQLDSIRNTTCLSGLLCKTSDYVDKIQKHAFFPASRYNPLIPCKSFPEIDYRLWKEHY
ncbi:Peroxidase-like protein [Dinothrombium tinctorium]|uniref:Peroxidase-like protein n=1 Tax=Dinothrombium tinctorium TaxID=1965070 RepID=A0A3S3PSS2_9ACAR|nr:Peroxidase-like protein [Dinothrombium tinctorium]